MHEIKLLLSISVQGLPAVSVAGQNRVTIALIHLRSVFFGHSSYSYKSPERRIPWIVSSHPVFRSYCGTNPSSFWMRLPSTAISSVYLSIISLIASIPFHFSLYPLYQTYLCLIIESLIKFISAVIIISQPLL